jgi:flagellar hook assembly protein FlgD
VTTIKFSIPEDVKNVKLIIYNSLGEKVSEMINTELRSGIYQYTWNAENFSSGLYLYQVVTEKFIQTKKMLLLK